jgi:iron-sulfur cluster assembly accessory protein
MVKDDFCFFVSLSAQDKLLDIINNKGNNNLKLRVTVDSGGCSGLQYKCELEEEVNDEDFILKLGNGTVVLIDNISQGFLNNSTLDYVTSLGAAYFKINNPKAFAKCGCGNSFSM